MAENKLAILKSNNKNTPPQGSDEWLIFRKSGIGGSEISTLLGINPWGNLRSLIEKKTGLSEEKFNFNIIACNWGIVMENVTIKLTEELFSTIVHEFNILKGDFPGQLYSPDGLGIVESYDNEYELVLFEFKAPFSSKLIGSIPKHYKAQIQDGLSVIKHAKKAIYISSIYRVCGETDFAYNTKYNTKFHSFDKNKKWKPSRLLGLGIIIVYQNKKDRELDIDHDFDFGNIDSYINPLNNNVVIDYGDSNDEQLKDIYSKISDRTENKTMNALYSDIFIIYENLAEIDYVRQSGMMCDYVDEVEKTKEIKEFLETEKNNLFKKLEKKNNAVVGIIPYKIFECDIIIEERDADYEKKIGDALSKVMPVINEINNEINIEKKKSILDAFLSE